MKEADDWRWAFVGRLRMNYLATWAGSREKGHKPQEGMGCKNYFLNFKPDFGFKIKRLKYFQTVFELEPK
jgi:hypothetical protein